MGEIAINPIHNVHKKYRTMNLVNSYIFTPPYVAPVENTFIGGVAGTLYTAALLASKLAIDVSRITAFSIVGSDVKFRITGSYTLPSWENDLTIKRYVDSDGLINSVVVACFSGCVMDLFESFGNFLINDSMFSNASINQVKLWNADTAYYFRCFKFKFCDKLFLPKLKFNYSTNVGDAFWNINKLIIPNVVNLGYTQANENLFLPAISGMKIYANQYLQTSNAGGEEGDVAYARASKSAIINYVNPANINIAPNPITDLSVGTVYATAIQVNFTPPTGSTNVIDAYDCYSNGIYRNTISGSGKYINNLEPNTAHNIEVKPVDIFYNKSSSNLVSQSTTPTYYTDVDANASIAAKSLTGSEQESEYLLITGFKSNSLYAKTQAIYTFRGNTAAQHKFNSKNPLDTNAAFRLTFSGNGDFRNSGYQTNGANSYANSYFIPSSNQDVNNNGITVVCGSNNPAIFSNTIEVGAYTGASQVSYLMLKNNNSNFRVRAALNSESPGCYQDGINESKGIFTGVKQSATIEKLFRNNVLLASAVAGGTLPNIPIFIGSMNFGGSPYNYSNQRLQMVIFHEGLSDAEVATLHSIIDLSETIAGRKTW